MKKFTRDELEILLVKYQEQAKRPIWNWGTAEERVITEVTIPLIRQLLSLM